MVSTRRRQNGDSEAAGSQEQVGDGPSTSAPAAATQGGSRSTRSKKAANGVTNPAPAAGGPEALSSKDAVKADTSAATEQQKKSSNDHKAFGTEDESDGDEQEEEEELDAFRLHPGLADAVRALQQEITDPTVFLQPSASVSTTARKAAEVLYQYSTQQLLSGSSRGEAKALRKGSNGVPLLMELQAGPSFDAEQIWTQMEMAADVTLKRIRRLVAKVAPQAGAPAALSLIKPEYEADIAALADGDVGGSSDDEGEDEDEEGLSDGSDGDDEDADLEALLDKEMKRSAKKRRTTGDDDDDEGPSDDDDEGPRGGKAKRSKAAKGAAAVAGGKALPGEDRFMKLSEMEAFLEDAEKRAAKGDEDDEDVADAGDEDEDDEDDDLAMEGFGGSDDEGEEEDDDMDELMRYSAKLAGKKGAAALKGKKATKDEGRRGAMYRDFFGGGNEAEDDGGADEEAGGEDEDEDQEDGGMMGYDDDEAGAGSDDDEDDEERPDGAKEGKQAAKAPAKLDKEALAAMSTHERRLARLQEKIAELEEKAMSAKDWTLIGEVDGSRRPLNSALAVDMDFDTTVKPPPLPSEEVMADLEAIIKKRIADHRFDDVVPVIPPEPERRGKLIELDDSKSKKGLGELYEEDYVRAAAGGVSEDKDEKVRAEARALFDALVAKLDALTHFNFTPKPVVEDMTVKSEVAAILMEEAAPVAVSKASMQLPGEVYKQQAVGKPLAEGELDREQRKQRRAKRKRGNKAANEQKEAEKRLRSVAEGGEAKLAGRKSAAAELAKVKQSNKRGIKSGEGAGASTHARTEFGKSTAVFARLQEQQEQAKAGTGPKGPKKTAQPTTAASLKL